MSRKDTILRILIVVGVLYTALLVVMIIFFAMSIHVLSGLRISYENNVGGQESETPVSAPMDEQEDIQVENDIEESDLPVSVPIVDDIIE